MKSILAVALLALSFLVSVSPAQAGADSPVVRNSVIEVNVVATGIVAQGIQGGSSTSKTSFLGFGRKKTSERPDMPATVNMGGVEVLGGTELSGTRISMNVFGSGLIANGSTLNLGIVRFTK